MKPILLSLFFLAIIWPTSVLAGHDITITCDADGPCQQSGELPFLEAKDIYPGFVQKPPQKLSAINRSLVDPCALQLQAKNLTGSTVLADVVDIQITSSEGTLYQDNLSGLLSPIALATIATDSTLDLFWTVSLPSSLGNDYQSLSTTIDLDFNFSCGQPSDEPTPTTGEIAGIGTASVGGANPGPPTCNDPTPNTPQNLTATDLGGGQVSLTWTQVSSPVTGYLIAYGPSPGNYLYGNPDIGLTDNYTVASLTPNAQYCFYVRAQNGCAPGSPSSEVCINQGSAIPALSAPAPGFIPGVLGAQSTPIPSSGPTSSDLGDIFGTTSDCQRRWLPILFLLALLINYLYLVNQSDLRPADRSPSRFVIPILVSLLAYAIDWYLLSGRCCLITAVYCRFFYLGNVLSVIIPTYFYFRHANYKRNL